MTGRMRTAMADRERLKTAAMLEAMSRRSGRRRWDRVYIPVAVLWAVLAAVPSLYVGRPVPFVVGSIAVSDVCSRVEFTWRDAGDETAAVRNVEARYARRYDEEPLASWLSPVLEPVSRLLTGAAATDDFAEVERIAAELKIAASDDELREIWRGAVVARNDPYHYLVRPLKEVLERDVFAMGVIDSSRADLERGRTIQIIRGDASHTALVGGEHGPVTAAQMGAILDDRLSARYSLWIPAEFKTAVADLVERRLTPTLVYDGRGSDAELARLCAQLLADVQTVRKNDVLVSRGDVITLARMAKLRAEERVFRETAGWRPALIRFIGNLILFLALALVFVVYFKIISENTGHARVKLYLSGTVLCLAQIFFGYWLVAMGLPGTLLPAGLVAGVAALGMNGRIAIFLTALSSLTGLILFEGRPDLMVGYLAGGWFFVSNSVPVRRRVLLLLMSLLSGLAGSAAFVAWNLARGDMMELLTLGDGWRGVVDEGTSPLVAVVALIANWLVCGVLILLFLPWIERFFGVTTRIHLQDLASQEHPLLKRLIVEAPGTYHHSTIVSTLAEAGAEAIGGDGLRARIGGFFHDIGKLVKPEYFTENESGFSRHDNLSPHMSALVIINHVKDGAEIARDYRLPASVVDMILQHHGTGMMRFFYHKAQTQAPPGTEVVRDPFIYPGPKPQTPETAVLMLADAVEAAVRSLDDPSPQHLRDLIARLARERLLDRQFEESGLTMSQLARVEEVFFRLLASMYHTRVKYPDGTGTKAGRKR